MRAIRGVSWLGVFEHRALRYAGLRAWRRASASAWNGCSPPRGWEACVTLVVIRLNHLRALLTRLMSSIQALRSSTVRSAALWSRVQRR